jgi:hypothetical protein
VCGLEEILCEGQVKSSKFLPMKILFLETNGLIKTTSDFVHESY